MDKIKDGGPAFPLQLHGARYSGEHLPQDGMTLRDYFAAKVLQGALADPVCDPVGTEARIRLAKKCYLMADAMLAAREA